MDTESTAGVVGLSPVQGTPAPDGSDCVACGRCCHHGPNTVHLLLDDEARMVPEDLERLTTVHPRPPFFRFMKHQAGHCAALAVTEAGYPCTVYETRPEVCRIVEAGSPCCLQARALGHLGGNADFLREPSREAPLAPSREP